MNEKTPFTFSGDVVHQLLLDMAQQRTTDSVFEVVVSRLAAFRNVAMARMWVMQPGDICTDCSMATECNDHSNCLHLVASAGQSTVKSSVLWTNLNGQHSRFPLGSRKVGHIAATGKPVVVESIGDDSQWIADINWAKREGILGFAGQPLVFQGRVLGVLAIFTKRCLSGDVLSVLRAIADHAAAALANAQAFEQIEGLKKKLEVENSYLREELFEVASIGGFVGKSALLEQVLKQVSIVAPTNASVLILGESGTGKELVAREIHHRSSRKDKPMIKVNCASIPKDLFESEFFGHAKGAFTGAVSERIGRFEAADGGTLFLDELGEIPVEHQSKLLRVLQEGEYERVGEHRTRHTDVRIIAATNRDLQEEVRSRLFREDLYFRLNVFPIHVPPLRKRKNDIEPLAQHFLQTFLRSMNSPEQQFSPEQLLYLQSYNWPGNVRELRNVIEQAAIYAYSGPLQVQLPQKNEKTIEKSGTTMSCNSGNRFEGPKVLTEDEMVTLQRDNIKAALVQCNWKIYGNDGAAALLGLRPTTLATRMKKMELRRH